MKEIKLKSYKGYKLHDDIYVDTSLYIGHGQDDFRGGKCQIIEIIEDQDLPDTNVNKVMFRVLENPNVQYNATNLIRNQMRLAEEFGEKRGYPDPDYGGDTDFW